jgi:hypothetical protein
VGINIKKFTDKAQGDIKERVLPLAYVDEDCPLAFRIHSSISLIQGIPILKNMKSKGTHSHNFGQQKVYIKIKFQHLDSFREIRA